jgi:hypothetical protein
MAVAPESTDVIIVSYGHMSTWAGMPEAPTDGNQYARKNAGWVQVVASGGTNFQTLTDAATIAWDCSLGSAKVTLGASRIMGLPSNMVAGQQYFLEIIQDGTGGRTITSGTLPFTGPPIPHHPCPLIRTRLIYSPSFVLVLRCYL